MRAKLGKIRGFHADASGAERRPSSCRRYGMLLCGGRRAEHANVQILDDYTGGPALGAGMHGHSWSELGSVETWPFRRHHFHPT